MKMASCDREQQVVDALASGRWGTAWGEEIRRHAAGCAACSEVVLVAEALRREEELAHAEARLPSAGLVWWKAQIAARRAAEERVTQPIAFVERAAQALAAFAVFGLAVWQWPRIAAWFSGKAAAHVAANPPAAVSAFPQNLVQGLAQVFSQPSGHLTAVGICAVLTVMGLAAYVVWREE